MLKSDFWDAVRLRYGLPLKRLSSHCGCSKPYNVEQVLSRKKDALAPAHSELRDNITEMPEEITSIIKAKPALQPF